MIFYFKKLDSDKISWYMISLWFHVFYLRKISNLAAFALKKLDKLTFWYFFSSFRIKQNFHGFKKIIVIDSLSLVWIKNSFYLSTRIPILKKLRNLNYHLRETDEANQSKKLKWPEELLLSSFSLFSFFFSWVSLLPASIL